MTQENKTVDISSRKVVTMRDVQDAAAAGASRRGDIDQLRDDSLGARFPAAAEYPDRRRNASAPAATASATDLVPQERQQWHPQAKEPGQSAAVFNAGSGRDQERDLRGRQETVDAPVCRRQRRQHLLSHRAQRSDLHADPGEQIRSHARRPLPGRSGRQPGGRRKAAHQRNLPAPRDLQGGAGGESGRPLPSAACHRVRHHRQGAAQPGDSGVRSIHRQGCDLSL